MTVHSNDAEMQKKYFAYIQQTLVLLKSRGSHSDLCFNGIENK